MILFLPAMIAVVGLHPEVLQPIILPIFGNSLIYDQLRRVGDDPEVVKQCYNGGAYKNKGVEQFGSHFGFHFRKRLLDPQPREDGIFHVLFKCNVCDQLNPSPFEAAKNDILYPPSNDVVQSRSEGWNVITKDDLKLQGYQVDKWDPADLSRRLQQPFSYPSDREFINRERIHNNSQPCINCGCMVTWSGNDLFI